MPRKGKKPSGLKPAAGWEPTAEEIEAACARIRQEWSAAEWQRARRRYGASVPNAQGSYRISSEVEVRD